MNRPDYLKKARDGDLQAFSQLVDQNKGWVFSLALQIVKNEEDAEEVSQDAFMKCYQHLGEFRFESKFSTWLYSIVYHTAISKTRKKKKNVVPLDSVQDSNFEPGVIENALGQIEATDQQRYLRLALEKIDDTDSNILTLFYLNDKPIKEIAEITGFSVGNIKMKLHRGRKALYQQLEKILRDEMPSLLEY